MKMKENNKEHSKRWKQLLYVIFNYRTKRNYYYLKFSTAICVILLMSTRIQAQNFNEIIKAVASDRENFDRFGWN